MMCCPHHWQGLLPVEHAVDVIDDLSDVVVGDFAGPTGADAFRAVHQHSGDDGNVPLWLHTLVVVIVVLEQVVIQGREYQAGNRAVRTNVQNVSVQQRLSGSVDTQATDRPLT